MKRASGKFVIRMPETLHARLKREAVSKGQSLNQICVARLQANVPPLAGFATSSTAASFAFPGFLDAAIRRWEDELVGIILFGSAARGEATEVSDIDLLLVMRPEVQIDRGLYRQWEDFCREQGSAQAFVEISPHFVRLPGSVEEAGGLWYETAIEGIVLWETDHRVSRFLASVRSAMSQGKIRRRMAHGCPYWTKEFKGA